MSSRIAWLVDLATIGGVAEVDPGSPLAVLDLVGSADCWSIAGARSLPIRRETRNPKGSLIDTHQVPYWLLPTRNQRIPQLTPKLGVLLG